MIGKSKVVLKKYIFVENYKKAANTVKPLFNEFLGDWFFLH
jgi:hypothetical protein